MPTMQYEELPISDVDIFDILPVEPNGSSNDAAAPPMLNTEWGAESLTPECISPHLLRGIGDHKPSSDIHFTRPGSGSSRSMSETLSQALKDSERMKACSSTSPNNLACLRCHLGGYLCDRMLPTCASCQIANSKCNRNGHVGEDVFSLFGPEQNLTRDINPSNPRDLEPSGFIGSGSFAENYRAQLSNGDIVAVKYPQRRNTSQLHQLILCLREALQWSKLQHPNIVLFAGIITDPSQRLLCMVTPYAENGNVLQFLERNPDAGRYDLISQVSDGLDYLHSQTPPIVHGGLKAANVLVSPTGIAQLTDCGLSFLVAELENTSSDLLLATEARWYSLERLYGCDPGDRKPASDVYSMSMTFLEVLTDKEPYHNTLNEVEIISFKRKGKTPEHPGAEIVMRGLSDELWLLMQRCWDSDPNSRPSSATVKSELRKWRPGQAGICQETSF